MIMNCKNCGKTIPNDSNFCQYCRTPIKDIALLPEKKVSVGGITCPKCGSHDLQVVADVTAKGVNGKKMCCGSSAIGSSCCGLGGLLAALPAIYGNLFAGICCTPSLCITLPTTILTGIGCAQTAATTGMAGGAAIGMHGAGETHTEHLWVCRHCGQKFKV